MFFVLSKIFDVLLSPLTWAMLLALLGLWRKRRWMRWAPAAAVGVLYVFSIEPVANALQRAIEGGAPRSVRKNVTYDAVILLGGVVDHEGTSGGGGPSYNENVERLLVTFELLRDGKASKVIVTGGRGWEGDPVNEARVLASQLERWGIARERILLEDRAVNTRENALYSQAIAKKGRMKELVVVTSAFHMRRALEAFRAVGLRVDALPVDYRAYREKAGVSSLPRARHLERSESALREVFGRWVYAVVGYGKS